MSSTQHSQGATAGFLDSFSHLLKERQEARHLVTALKRRLDAAVQGTRVAASKLEQIRARDVHAMAMTVWQEALVLVLFAASECWFNYLAAEGLFIDHALTIGVAFALTVIAGMIAFALAHEERNHRIEQHQGEVTQSRHRVAFVAGLGIIFLIVTYFLRKAYFTATAKLQHDVFGTLPLAPWLTALVLTGIAGIFMVLAAYVLAHGDNDLATAKSNHHHAKREASQLEEALRRADARLDRAETALHTHVIVTTNGGSDEVITHLEHIHSHTPANAIGTGEHEHPEHHDDGHQHPSSHPHDDIPPTA